jgi:hypothetical protein
MKKVMPEWAAECPAAWEWECSSIWDLGIGIADLYSALNPKSEITHPKSKKAFVRVEQKPFLFAGNIGYLPTYLIKLY